MSTRRIDLLRAAVNSTSLKRALHGGRSQRGRPAKFGELRTKTTKFLVFAEKVDSGVVSVGEVDVNISDWLGIGVSVDVRQEQVLKRLWSELFWIEGCACPIPIRSAIPSSAPFGAVPPPWTFGLEQTVETIWCLQESLGQASADVFHDLRESTVDHSAHSDPKCLFVPQHVPQGISRPVLDDQSYAALRQCDQMQIMTLGDSGFFDGVQRNAILDRMQPDAIENRSLKIREVDRVSIARIIGCVNNSPMNRTFQLPHAPGAVKPGARTVVQSRSKGGL